MLSNIEPQKEPYVVHVVGVDADIERFRNFILPFSTIHSNNINLASPTGRNAHNNNNNNNHNIVSVRRKMNKNTIVNEVRFILSFSNNNDNQNNNNSNNLLHSPGSRNQHNININSLPVQCYLVLCDSQDDESLSRAGDLAQTEAAPRVPLVMCDINLSTDGMQECQDARSDLTAQMYSLPEFCQMTALAAWAIDEETLALHRHWSANEHAVDLLCGAVVDAVLYPKHLLWDGSSTLTTQARNAIRRSFWMLDRDGDKALSDVELCGFTQAVYERVATQDDINEVKFFVDQIIDRQVREGRDFEETKKKFLQAPPHSKKKDVMELPLRDCYITLVGFFAMCHFMVSEARHTMVWKLLNSHGIQPGNDCKPFRDEDIERAIEEPLIAANQNNYGTEDYDGAVAAEGGNEKNSTVLINGVRRQSILHSHQQTYSLHLSEVGAAFFASLYKKIPIQIQPQQQNQLSSENSGNNTTATHQDNDFDPTSLFLFTPSCPWKTVYGIPDGEEKKLTVTEFVNCWKFMAQVDPATVAMFAKYWDFDGLVSQVENVITNNANNNNNNNNNNDSVPVTPKTTIVSRDLSSLFVARKMRRFRTPKTEYAADVSIPPSASFLVLGSGGCGKTTLMQHLSNPVAARLRQQQQVGHTPGRSVALLPVHLFDSLLTGNLKNALQQQVVTATSITPQDESGAPAAAAAATVGTASSRYQQEILISLRELEDMEIDDVLSDTAVMDTMDGVVLCYDGNDPYSFGFVAAVLPKLSKRENLPIAVVLCKGDLEVEDQLGLKRSPEELLRSVYGLPWPPVGVSVVSSVAPPNKPFPGGMNNIKNDIDNFSTILAELVLHPELSTVAFNAQQSESTKKLNEENNVEENNNNNNNSSARIRMIKNPRKRNIVIQKQQRLKMIKRGFSVFAIGAACAYVGYYLDHKYNWTEKYVPSVVRNTLIAVKDAIPTPIRRGIVGGVKKVRDTIDSVVKDLMMIK